MKFSEAMAFYDYKQIKIVKALKVARDTVKAWKREDHIPFKMQCVIEVLTNGKLRADKEAWENGDIL